MTLATQADRSYIAWLEKQLAQAERELARLQEGLRDIGTTHGQERPAYVLRDIARALLAEDGVA